MQSHLDVFFNTPWDSQEYLLKSSTPNCSKHLGYWLCSFSLLLIWRIWFGLPLKFYWWFLEILRLVLNTAPLFCCIPLPLNSAVYYLIQIHPIWSISIQFIDSISCNSQTCKKDYQKIIRADYFKSLLFLEDF